MLFSGKIPFHVAARLTPRFWVPPHLLRFATICHYSRLLAIIRDRTIRHYSRLFETIRTIRTIRYSGLFAVRYSGLFAVRYSGLFAVRHSGLFAVRYSRLFAIRYSGFPDTPIDSAFWIVCTNSKTVTKYS